MFLDVENATTIRAASMIPFYLHHVITLVSLIFNLIEFFDPDKTSALALCKEQAKLYRIIFAKAGLDQIHVSTVNAMQGSENGAALFDSTVCQDREGGLRFVIDARGRNVPRKTTSCFQEENRYGGYMR